MARSQTYSQKNTQASLLRRFQLSKNLGDIFGEGEETGCEQLRLRIIAVHAYKVGMAVLGNYALKWITDDAGGVVTNTKFNQ
jgi:hypothetical protein